MHLDNHWNRRGLYATLTGLFLATRALCQIYPPITGSVSGFVRDSLGKPVVGAIVTRTQTFSANLGAQSATVVPSVPPDPSKISQSDGTFYFPNLPPGSHQLCSQLLGSTLLDPCAWSALRPM